jgi:hypothetical protein
VEAAVMTALSKLPADRFSTAAQFGEALSRPGIATVAVAAARTVPVRAIRRARAMALAPWVIALLAVGTAVRVRRERYWIRPRKVLLRATYLLDQERKIRWLCVNDLSVGRSTGKCYGSSRRSSEGRAGETKEHAARR